MKRYFENKIGQTLGRTVTTGNKSAYGATYARQYFAEILDVAVTGTGIGFVTVNRRSQDLTPSGMLAGGTQKYFGDFEIQISRGLEGFWRNLLKQADPTMVQYLRR